MIKRILLLVALAAIAVSAVNAQCVPDTSITQEGIYPDSATGLPAGTVGLIYNEVIQLKVLTDTSLAGIPVTVDSIKIDQVLNLPPGITYTCTPASCIFPGGSNGCILLSGTPTTAGSFPMTVNLLVYVTFLGSPVSQPSTVDYYVIDINNPVGLNDIHDKGFSVISILPHPITDRAEVTYSVSSSGTISLSLYDMLGREVYHREMQAERGSNKINIETAQLNSGIYMLNIDNGKSAITRKVVVSNK